MKRASWMAASVGMMAVLGWPLAASAKTVVVDSNGPAGACGGTAPTCRTLTDASSSSVTLPGDTVEVRPGFYPESPTFGQQDLTLKGTGAGPVLIVGTLTVSNPGDVTVSRLLLESADGSPLAFTGAPPPIPLTHTIVVEGTGLVTAKSAPALSMSLSLVATETVNAVVRHVSAVNTGGSAIALNASGGTFNPTVKNSIALGGIDPGGANGPNNDTGSSPTSLFCDAALHLVNTASARGAGGALDPGEVGEDIDGESRGATPDRGADQYSNKCDPAPNAAPPLPPTGLTPAVGGGPAAPSVSIVSPKQGQKLTRTAKRRRHSHRKPKAKPLAFTGTASDPLGVTSVQLALRKTGGGSTTCKWFDGKRLEKVPCAQVILLPATVSTSSWTYVIPSKASLPKGSYLLYATAVNRAGVAQTTFSPTAGNVVGFKVK